jgi:hypothetical protein
MSALAADKVCRACGEAKPLGEFYRSVRQVQPYCIPCHNAKCVARVKASPVLRRKQSAAKARWQAAHPERKRVHEGRSIFLQRPESPALLQTLERAVMALSA